MTFRQYIRILVIAARSFIAGIVLVFFLPGAGALGDFFAVALTALICGTLTTLVVTTITVKIKFRDKRHYMRFLDRYRRKNSSATTFHESSVESSSTKDLSDPTYRYLPQNIYHDHR